MSAGTSVGDGHGNTVLDLLIGHLHAKDLALDGQERPAAILWTDPKAEWAPVIEVLKTRLPELLVLGEYAEENRTGPAIWIRCLVEGTLDSPDLPAGTPPVVYLPGVSRQQLRAGEECPEEVKPLVELMYRGSLWLQANGNDWTVTAFLTSPKALGLDIARDAQTTEALLRALPEVSLTPVSQLAGRRLEADDFDKMLSDDPVRDLLRWMGDPEGARARMGANGWAAFVNQCKDELGFDPGVEADVVAGEKLGAGGGVWDKVWDRFVESPTAFPGVVELLRRSRPVTDLPFTPERWPDLNDEDEEGVRAALAVVLHMAHGEACAVLSGLAAKHDSRRRSVWARLGLSPMAEVLEPLSRLARSVGSAIGGATPDDAAAAYVDRGWQADAAAWEAIVAAPAKDEAAVQAVVHHLLKPWLDDSARAFQKAVSQTPLPGAPDHDLVEAGEGECLCFADGLRYDLGVRLVERLERQGCIATLRRRWAALPTVTATAKPAVTPVANDIEGGNLDEGFEPALAVAGKPARAPALRKAMEDRGYQVLDGGTLELPLTDSARGWVETGEIDTIGHKLKGRLARQIGDELDRIAVRIMGLLDAGWRSVRVVTDHGWLLLPGGLPKVDLPKHLTESRWARCAVIKGASSPEVDRVPWHWNPAEHFATAPGIACFNKSEEYAHGGLSLQECLIPDIFVERGESAPAASITSVTWRGLRCFPEVKSTAAQVRADLRLGSPSGRSVVAQVKAVDDDGSVSLVLAGDEHEEDQLVLVLLDESGSILAHRPTRVGAA
jgi:hypothetical protein